MGRRRPIIPGGTYFITADTVGQQRWFARPVLAQIVVEQWHHYEVAYGFRLYTYCVLPDHYHVVLDVGQEKSISQILHAVNSYVATLVNERLGQRPKCKIWQRGAWDEVIRDEEMYWQKIAYVLLNPWRLGLVREPLEPYPFSDLGEWLEREGREAMDELFGRYARRGE